VQRIQRHKASLQIQALKELAGHWDLNSPSVLQGRRLKSADLAFVDFAGASNPTRANSTPPLRGPLVDFSTEDELALFPRSIGGRNERRELSAILKSGPELEDVEPVDQWFSRLGDGLSSDAVAD
jgi:hypothetical protein